MPLVVIFTGPPPGATARVEPETAPESDSSGHGYECGYKQGDGDTDRTGNDGGNGKDFWAIANLRGDVRKFWRHRDRHFRDRRDYSYPNKTGTIQPWTIENRLS